MRAHAFKWGVLGKALASASLLIWLNGTLNAQAPDVVALQRRIEAGFLYNFVQLTEWPSNAFPSTHSPITLGVLGVDPFGTVLESALTNRQVAGRFIVLRRFKRGEDIRECHLLFISASERDRLGEVLGALDSRSVLTVGECPGFAAKGGMIEFVPSPQGNIVFKINNAATAHAGLKLSSHLLKLHLAEIVDPKTTMKGD